MKIGKTIKMCRTLKNMNQNKLAERAKISDSYLSLIEQDKRDPNLSVIENIADALDIPISILIFLAAEKDDLKGISDTLAEKLSHTALKLIGDEK